MKDFNLFKAYSIQKLDDLTLAGFRGNLKFNT